MRRVNLTVIAAVLIIVVSIPLNTTLTASNSEADKLSLSLDNIRALKNINATVILLLSFNDGVQQVINKSISLASGDVIKVVGIFNASKDVGVWYVRIIDIENGSVMLDLEGVVDLRKEQPQAWFVRTYYDPTKLSIPLSPSVITISTVSIEGIINVEVGVVKHSPYNLTILVDGDLSGDFSSSEASSYVIEPVNNVLSGLHKVTAKALKAPFKVLLTYNHTTLLRIEGIIDWTAGSAVQLEGWRDESLVTYAKISATYNLTGAVLRLPNDEIIHKVVTPTNDSLGHKSIAISIGEDARTINKTAIVPTAQPLIRIEDTIERINEILKNYWPFIALFIGLAIVLAVLRR
ncbi:MAG: hypothetical protein B7O98_08880 [Zestosphaera tikiterensis]|uniref:Uncharacterized protein n=1 Tax=Zestosphaera tikiterensis TaxID=1973259 RepID=A0A2R7Y2Z3_9CREN|nr:MAG: hypothetical protein B7O98_08710 [Zestosphaera tikiterensis]PUA31727.1 MAG: hypothetical protein B7O98_08880 [Zestosphaera tikiterensis]